MKLEEILDNWEKDAPIDQSKLGAYSLGSAKLHSKYIRMLSEEKMQLAAVKAKLNALYLQKLNYYTSKMTDEERKELGWPINPLRINRAEAGDYIQGDSDYIKQVMRLAMQQEKVDSLDSILKNISVRQFMIKNTIDYMRLMNGG